VDTQADVGTLAALVAKNLVVRRAAADGRTRLRMLATIHEYADERLSQNPGAAAVRDRHCRYFVDLAERAERGLRGREQRIWARRLDDELGNLRAATAWALGAERPELAVRLVGAAGLFYGFQRGRLREVRAWLEEALAAGHRLPLSVRAKASLALAVALQNLGDADAALRRCREAVRLYRRASDVAGLSQSLAELSFMEFEAPSVGPRRAEAAGREALELARAANDPWTTLFALSANVWLAPDYDAAQRLAEEALAIARQLGVLDQQAMILSNIGFRAIEEGDYPYGRAATAEAVALLRDEVDDITGFAIGLGNLGLVATLEGEHDEAQAALDEVLRACREHGLVRPVAESLVALAALAARSAQPARAARLCGAADAMACDAPTGTDRKLQAEARETGCAALGTERWRSEWERGRELGFDDAIAYALREHDSEERRVTGLPSSPTP
jgi:tetratricopeptide (TPR) repeat protein